MTSDSHPAFWTRDQKIAWLDKEFQISKNPLLDKEKQQRSLNLLLEFWDIFSVDGSFGCTDLITHEIYTQPGHPPLRCKYRPVRREQEECLQAQLDTWKKHDVIEESNSPWSFPLVPVPKKNGQTRWCIDYRRLNDITQRDATPCPPSRITWDGCPAAPGSAASTAPAPSMWSSSETRTRPRPPSPLPGASTSSRGCPSDSATDLPPIPAWCSRPSRAFLVKWLFPTWMTPSYTGKDSLPPGRTPPSAPCPPQGWSETATIKVPIVPIPN